MKNDTAKDLNESRQKSLDIVKRCRACKHACSLNYSGRLDKVCAFFMPIEGHSIFEGKKLPSAAAARSVKVDKEVVGDFKNKNHYSAIIELEGYNGEMLEFDLQVVDILEAFKITERYKWNIAKYVLRAGKKPGVSELKDMTKLRNYADRRIRELRAQGEEL